MEMPLDHDRPGADMAAFTDFDRARQHRPGGDMTMCSYVTVVIDDCSSIANGIGRPTVAPLWTMLPAMS